MWCLWSLRSQGKAEARREAAGEGNFGCFKLLGPELGVLEEQLSSFFLSTTEQNIKMMLHEALSFVGCLVGLGLFSWLFNVFLSRAVRSRLLGYMTSD